MNWLSCWLLRSPFCLEPRVSPKVELRLPQSYCVGWSNLEGNGRQKLPGKLVGYYVAVIVCKMTRQTSPDQLVSVSSLTLLVFCRSGPCSSSRARSTKILSHFRFQLNWARGAKYQTTVRVSTPLKALGWLTGQFGVLTGQRRQGKARVGGVMKCWYRCEVSVSQHWLTWTSPVLPPHLPALSASALPTPLVNNR